MTQPTGDKSVNRSILALAIPAIVNNVTIPLLGLCDTAIAGHLGNASFIGAMAVGAMMLNVIYWLCGFLRMAAGGLTAQATGANDLHTIHAVLVKSLLIALAISVAAIALQIPLLKLFLLVIAPDATVSQLASTYFTICIWAAPAQLGIMAVSGWFIGRQNTLVPMLVAVGVNVVNIALSLILVFGFHSGFAGVAVGTLVAAWLGLIAILMVARRFLAADGLPGPLVGSGSLRGSWRPYFRVSSDLFFRSACIMGVSMAMTSFTARLGDETLAANAVMMQFFLFFSYFMDGFAFAGEALVGKATGASDNTLKARAVRGLLRWGAAMAVTFLLIYAFFTSPIVALLTDNEPVRTAVSEMHSWILLLPPITVAAFLYDGIYIGMTRTRALLVTTLIAAAVFFSMSFFPLLSDTLPSFALLWTAFESYLLLRGILLAAIYKYPRKIH